MEHILDILKERGFIAQTTFEDELYEQLKTPTTFYVGFDPTADSLHIGHYIPIMAMAHMQRAADRPDGRRNRHDRRSFRQDRYAQDAHHRNHRSQCRMH